MKKFNLFSIFTLFITLLCTQNIVAQTRVPNNETGTWYTYYNDTQYTLSGKDNYENKAYTINFKIYIYFII